MSHFTIAILRRVLARPAALLLLGMLLLAGCGRNPVVITQAGMAPDAPGGTLLDPPKELADFTLTSHTGAPLGLQDLRGRPALVFFGYTNCPDVCPLTMAEWKKVKQDLGDAARDVAFVFISVDPERDTPEVVARFVGGYDPSFIGLTGDEPDLQAIAKDFGVFFRAHDDHGTGKPPLVDHLSRSFLLDRKGRMHMLYSYGMSADTITADIRELLAQG
ncbi:MAG TPA: SCO family protein [Herpetosiphonaceae bacterium]|nr:SCO family protein [Herpetosiphonaceae bacterium]